MAAPLPKIDQRSLESILAEIRELAQAYTPEWNATQDRGPGAVLQRIFARMLEGLVQRLNEVPQRNFIEFLNMLGFKLLPAQPARTALTFYLSKGAKTPAVIPQRTQVAGTPPEGGDPVIFETESTILATPAKLIYSNNVVPQQDSIFEPPPLFLTDKTSSPFTARLLGGVEPDDKLLFLDDTSGFAEGDLLRINVPEKVEYATIVGVEDTTVGLANGLLKQHRAGIAVQKVTDYKIFEGKNRQEHSLYLAHGDLLNLEGEAKIKLSGSSFTALGDNNLVDWEYLGIQVRGEGDSEIEEKGWHQLDIDKVEHNQITLQKQYSGEIKETEIDGLKSRWIRCRLKPGKISEGLNIQLDELKMSSQPPATGIDGDMGFHNDIELDLTSRFVPFGQEPRRFDTFYLASQEAFSKKGAEVKITITVEHSTPIPPPDEIPVKRVHGIGDVFEQKLIDAGIMLVDKLLEYTPAELAPILDTNALRATNILEAAEKVFLDKSIAMAAAMTRVGTNALETTDNFNAVLAWEYWNGQGWVKLPLTDESKNENLIISDEALIVFHCPDDMAITSVTGQESFWIRSRIISGDYGGLVFSYDKDSMEITSESTYDPPEISKLKIEYAPPAEALDHLLLFNNLQYEDRTADAGYSGIPFPVFQPLDEPDQALYFGFDQPPLKGPISIFLSLAEQEYLEDHLPRVVWEYFRKSERQEKGEWARLDVQDGTRNFTETGTVALTGPPDFALLERFGKPLYWVRALDLGSKFQPRITATGAGITDAAASESCSKLEICDETLRTFHPRFTVSGDALIIPALPIIHKIYLNTAWASQTETIRDEIAGSSDGSINQVFSLNKFPVISEEIWVNEFGALSEAERKALENDKFAQTEVVSDEAGNLLAFWVLWRPVEDLIEATEASLVYEIDRTFGVLKFGDLLNGKVPPIGRNNIVANYRAGGGSKGNLDKGIIKTLRTTIPLIDSAVNPEPAGGGSNTEVVTNALLRGPQAIRNRGRAVTVEDFESLAREASRNVGRVKCLPLFNDSGSHETNWVTVIIVPDDRESRRPFPSPQLRLRVENYLTARAASVTVFPNHVQVSGPVYVEVNVAVDIFPVFRDRGPDAEKAALQQADAFLHPLTGGDQNTGWEFGRVPCLSDFYSLFEAIESVDHVENLSLILRIVSPDGETLAEETVDELNPLNARMPEYALIFSGDHTITLK